MLPTSPPQPPFRSRECVEGSSWGEKVGMRGQSRVVTRMGVLRAHEVSPRKSGVISREGSEEIDCSDPQRLGNWAVLSNCSYTAPIS